MERHAGAGSRAGEWVQAQYDTRVEGAGASEEAMRDGEHQPGASIEGRSLNASL